MMYGQIDDPTPTMMRIRSVLDTIDYREAGHAIRRVKEWVAVLLFQPYNYPAAYSDQRLGEWKQVHTVWVFITALESAYVAGHRYGSDN